MRGDGLWQLGYSVTRRLAQTKTYASARCFSSETELKKTVLHDFHVANGGKMVPFAGWSMPIQYKDSIMESTVNCRENGGLFDFSYMSGLSLMGKDCIPFIEKLVVSDIAGLAQGTGTFSVFTNDKGGIIEDAVVVKVKDDHIYLVVNAGNCRAKKNLEHIEDHMNAFKSKGGDVSWRIHNDRSLLSLQGPLAATVLQCITKENLSKIYYGQFKIVDIYDAQCFLTRTGYSGEDGFEISVPSERAIELAKVILEKSQGKVRLSGLGARDSLKLEAGLCLYGNERDITPVEAGLTWAIGKRRRAEGGFLGADLILKQIEVGPLVRRVGFVSSGPPSRKKSVILNMNEENIGEVTSGGFSPCLKKNIAIGYVRSGNHGYGNHVKILIRGKSCNGTVTKLPFVNTKYYNPN